jgi:hypothetical protein
VLRPFYQLLVKIANRVPARQARRRSHNPFNDAVLGRHLRGACRHPDNVVQTTNSGAGQEARKYLLFRELFGWEAGI